MSLWKRLFGKKSPDAAERRSEAAEPVPRVTLAIPPVQQVHPSAPTAEAVPSSLPVSQAGTTPLLTHPAASASANRRIRVFISSTFRDMIEERDELMTHAWPELRRFCRERQVELVEVDLRWGIAEEQSTRKETLKLCLDEIRACRPFFIGLLGERYGWVPGDDAFTADLQEEQPWLQGPRTARASPSWRSSTACSTTPTWPDAPSSTSATQPTPWAGALTSSPKPPPTPTDKLPSRRRFAPSARRSGFPCTRTTLAPGSLRPWCWPISRPPSRPCFPRKSIPDPLSREAQDHDAFAEIRRRTYDSNQESGTVVAIPQASPTAPRAEATHPPVPAAQAVAQPLTPAADNHHICGDRRLRTPIPRERGQLVS